MADLEDVTLDGRPLQSLRVADLKAALEERGLSKSGQKNALVKRLKGALMLENLQRTSTAHIGLQPNSQIGEEMSQNSFIKQYLAKQQELLRQRLEREAREAYETNEQEDRSQVNNSTSCPPQVQDASGAEQHKPPGPSVGEELFDLENTREGNRDQENDLSLPPASGSLAMHGPGEHHPERCSASSEVTADSDDEDGEEDGDKDDWDSSARRGHQQPARVPTIRDRSGASCQPQQQHIPSLLSPQLRQPTPPPSPPPELSFPLPDTPKQSPPSPDVAPARRSSSSGSSSSDSCSSSPEPQRSGHAERKPGPLTLLARKMESEGAFSGAGWHVGDGEGDRQETSSPSTTLFPARSPLEGLVSDIAHTASTIGHLPMVPGNTQGVTGGHSVHIQVPMSVLRATAKDERDCELEREKAPDLERQEPAEEVAWERILVLAGEESQKAFGKEGIEQPQASEQEKLSKSRKSQPAQDQERELALAKEREVQEQCLAQDRALELERQKQLERQKALELERHRNLEKQRVLEQERLQKEKREREEMELERVKAMEMEKALEQERIDRERALEAERKETERIEREKQEMLEMERLARKKEREKSLEQARLEKERALEQERIEKEKALKQERLESEKEEMDLTEARMKMVVQELEVKNTEEMKTALEQERMTRAENERKEHLEREKCKEHENLERDKALEKKQKEKEQEEERIFFVEGTVEKEKVTQKEEQETVAEKERESHLPPFKRGHALYPTPLPTPTLLSTGKARKPLAEAGEQNDAPVSRNEAESSAHMSPTPLSPQSLFKRSMFLRDSPIPPQSSSTSVVIKRPCTFSDTLQPQASHGFSLISLGEAQQERYQPSTKKEDTPCRKDEFAAESVEIQSEKKNVVSATLGQTTKEEGATDVELVKAEHGNESIKTMKEVDKSREKGDARKEIKQRRQRSPSSDSSSELDSGSPSSRSSRSSTSQENTSFGSRGEEKLKRDPSSRHSVTVEPQMKASEETSRASPHTRVTSAENSSRAADGNSPTKKPSSVDLPSKPTREERQRKRNNSEEEEEKDKQRQVNETTMAQAEKSSETSEATPKVFSPRKISLTTPGTKSSPGTGSAESEQDSGTAGGRKRRWGSSTAVTAKKPSISITTDSLKSLIPDFRPPLGQEAVVDLHPEEAVLSEAEDEERECTDQDLQICRTVTQVVHSERQENGQKEAKRSRHEEQEDEDTERTKVHEEKMDTPFPGAVETQPYTSHDVEINTVTPSDTLIRRSISQQKTSVSITIDDPVRTSRQPSPPRGKVSNIVHICNLVRPFTLGQLKELLSRTGALVEEGFWIDRIKSHCYVTYSNSEEAVATRTALHGVKWPQSNPKVLSVEFSHQDELDFHKGLGTTDKSGADEQGLVSGHGRASGIPSLLPERDQWAEREREMERRERARAEREWDRDKVREFGKVEDKEGGPHRSRSRERRRKERGKSKEKKADKKEKTTEDPPAKLLDDLFCKTKAPPCIYWLPLTEEQYIQRQAARAERIKEREKRRQEQEEEEEKKKEEERKEKMKAGGSTTGDRAEGEKDKDRERGRDRERERERERENDKRRDGYRRPGGGGAGGNRRSRSRSAPRERRH
ncbi:apoptotic chromatin condensation inducer in the nucleus isoform X2 [Betta splendens]|uniref:Apoptotic chromatin condensation inducer in the nucleus isoform X2 n=1 Tax=Betta splendens TaxID=158456 RepID=A0A6P7KVU8_BETSP|nr:apoptotic chromatin condensation inducer in the nucleus isoform X2 [Betta splendens]